jgi:flavin reductase (DIM6/NTAB) family NADH-FMN oxidoreductase RutF
MLSNPSTYMTNGARAQHASFTSNSLPDMESLLEEQSAMNAIHFRDGMRLMANSVVIVTSTFEGVRRGLTATAVCSLSAEPPMLAVCINKSSSAYPTIHGGSHFAVNCLSRDQRPVADAFAGGLKHDERFMEGHWTEGETGVPVLQGTVTTFECELHQTVDVATHTLFIGLVKSVRNSSETEPLIYHNRAYKQCA